MLKKKGGGFLGHARRAASAVSVLALFSSMTGAAYADGKYMAQMSIPGGQAPTCANTPKTVEFTVTGGKITTADAKCVGELPTGRLLQVQLPRQWFGHHPICGAHSGRQRRRHLRAQSDAAACRGNGVFLPRDLQGERVIASRGCEDRAAELACPP